MDVFATLKSFHLWWKFVSILLFIQLSAFGIRSFKHRRLRTCILLGNSCSKVGILVYLSLIILLQVMMQLTIVDLRQLIIDDSSSARNKCIAH